MIIVDVETTGLDPRASSLVSIGALNFNEPKNIFYEECRIWDGAVVEQLALDRNGYSREQIQDTLKQPESELIGNFLNWFEKQKEMMIGGQFVSFDHSFLKEATKRAGLAFPLTQRSVDLHSISYVDHLKKGIEVPVKDGKPNLSLDNTLEYVGLPKESMPHLAINGVKLEAEAFSRFIHRKNLLKEYAQYPLPSHLLL